VLVEFMHIIDEFYKFVFREPNRVGCEIFKFIHIVNVVPNDVEGDFFIVVRANDCVGLPDCVVPPSALMPPEGPVRDKCWRSDQAVVLGDHILGRGPSEDVEVKHTTNCAEVDKHIVDSDVHGV
jgi:hypothetical protein